MAPGWIRTQLDGPKAPFGVDDSMPLIVDVLFVRQGKPGLAFLDRDGTRSYGDRANTKLIGIEEYFLAPAIERA